MKRTTALKLASIAIAVQACWAYSFQTFSALEVLGASKMNQIEVNIRDHRHGEDGVAAVLRPGFVIAYGGSTEPDGWIFCYGQAISRTTFAELFGVIDTAFGAGDGSTTFNVPDIRGRVIAGKDDMGGSAASRITAGGSGITGTTLGASGGAQTVTISTSTMPTHAHNIVGNDNDSGGGVGGKRPLISTATGSVTTNYSTDNNGSGGAHNNMQPTIILNYLIKT